MLLPASFWFFSQVGTYVGGDEFEYSFIGWYLIKCFKDVNARLVDGAHNSATCVDSITNSAHHNCSSSSIKSTSWLIHEDDGGVGHQLHRNC